MDPDTGRNDAPWLQVKEYVPKTSGEPNEPWWYCAPCEKWAAPTHQVSQDHINNVKNKHIWFHDACPQGSDEDKTAWCSTIMSTVELHSTYVQKREDDEAEDWRSTRKAKVKAREGRGEQWQSEGHQQVKSCVTRSCNSRSCNSRSCNSRSTAVAAEASAAAAAAGRANHHYHHDAQFLDQRTEQGREDG
eukprot:32482-Pyramimonas_sp.AAC.1